jgi:hypothetical protein
MDPLNTNVSYRCCSMVRNLSLVEQELLILPDPLSSPPVFSGVRVTDL